MDLPPYIVRDFSQALVMAGSGLSNGVDPDQRGKWRGRDQVGGEMVVFQISFSCLFYLGQYFSRKPGMPLYLVKFLTCWLFSSLLLFHEFSKAACTNALGLSMRTTSINIM